jgi:hypothetical protein
LLTLRSAGNIPALLLARGDTVSGCPGEKRQGVVAPQIAGCADRLVGDASALRPRTNQRPIATRRHYAEKSVSLKRKNVP